MPQAELVETVIEDVRWEALGLGALAERASRAALLEVALDPGGHEVSLLGCDDARIAALNADFRGKPQPTNVLSWPSDDLAPETDGAVPRAPRKAALGDIAIAFETCTAEAATAGLAVADHVTHLLVHGTLHLLGYDHVRDGDADRMERIEVACLASLGVADPYG